MFDIHAFQVGENLVSDAMNVVKENTLLCRYYPVEADFFSQRGTSSHVTLQPSLTNTK